MVGSSPPLGFHVGSTHAHVLGHSALRFLFECGFPSLLFALGHRGANSSCGLGTSPSVRLGLGSHLSTMPLLRFCISFGSRLSLESPLLFSGANDVPARDEALFDDITISYSRLVKLLRRTLQGIKILQLYPGSTTKLWIWHKVDGRRAAEDDKEKSQLRLRPTGRKSPHEHTTFVRLGILPRLNVPCFQTSVGMIRRPIRSRVSV
mmetsp:Transcript_28449/g.75107  ORF Transcript_28449/g.75107 Transcript_28449/m.75107 type:complete len:206 (+) Transcript_28449:2560-3177(+)